ncbi:MAG: DMT family transporter [Leptospirales bacterium]
MIIIDAPVVNSKSNVSKGYLFAVITAIFFGINSLGIRYAFNQYPSLNPETGMVWGFIGALILVLPYYVTSSPARKRLIVSFKRDGWVILAISVLTSIGGVLWIFALKHAAAGVVSLLAKVIIVYSAIFGLIFLKERFTLIELSGFALLIPGVFLIATLESQVAPKAVAAVLVSAFIYAIQSLLVKKYAPQLHGMEFTYLRAICMVILFGTIFVLLGRVIFIPIEVVFILGTVSVSGMMLGRALYFEAHKYLEISKLNSAMLIEPVIVLVAAFFLLGEPLDAKKVYGGLFILVGLWLLIHRSFRGRV